MDTEVEDAHLLSPFSEVDPVIGLVELVNVVPAVGPRQGDVDVETSATASHHDCRWVYFGWTQNDLFKWNRWLEREESPWLRTFFIGEKLEFGGIWRLAVVVRCHHCQVIHVPLELELQLG